MKETIFLDDQVFSLQKYGGITNYHIELYNRLLNEKIEVNPCFVYTKNLSAQKTFKKKLLNISSLVLLFINYIYAFISILFKRPKLVHRTYHIPLIYFCKSVITIHDLAYEKFSKKNINIILRKLSLKLAKHIIVPSVQTKTDLMNFYPISEDKISVIHHGFSGFNNQKKYRINDKYVLYVGLRKGYKNFEFFVNASKDSLIKKNISLICFGGPSFSPEEEKLLQGVSYKYVKFDEKIQKAVYSQALCFVYPSLNEGFGIPLLEAMGAGTPLLISDIGCFNEVAKDSAIYFNPRNSSDLLKKLDLLVKSEDLRRKLISKGKKRVKLFTWEKCAKETLEVYTRVMK